jgi:hypothetical protein
VWEAGSQPTAIFMINNETPMGGRGKCSICGEWHNNVAFHEAKECLEPKEYDGIELELVSKVLWQIENEKRQLKFAFMKTDEIMGD